MFCLISNVYGGFTLISIGVERGLGGLELVLGAFKLVFSGLKGCRKPIPLSRANAPIPISLFFVPLRRGGYKGLHFETSEYGS